jgi:calcineurin-like phosphoesterase family protein
MTPNLIWLEPEDLFLVSDLHSHHQRVWQDWHDRPADFTQVQMQNLFALADGQNSLLNLGDLVFGTPEQKCDFVSRYNVLAKKFHHHYYIYGNHDKEISGGQSNITHEKIATGKQRYFVQELLPPKYDWAAMKFSSQKILFSHCPLAAEELTDFDYNIHGHIHRFKPANLDFGSENRALENDGIFTPKHLLISMEYQHLHPVRLSTVLANPENFSSLNKLHQLRQSQS